MQENGWRGLQDTPRQNQRKYPKKNKGERSTKQGSSVTYCKSPTFSGEGGRNSSVPPKPPWGPELGQQVRHQPLCHPGTSRMTATHSTSPFCHQFLRSLDVITCTPCWRCLRGTSIETLPTQLSSFQDPSLNTHPHTHSIQVSPSSKYFKSTKD